MPAAAGDGLLGEPAAVAAGAEGRRAAADGGSFLAAWLSAAAPRERLRDFQHTKRVGNYLIGRKLGEGSFAKVREGLHVITGEKVAVKVIDKKRAKKDTYVTKNLRREGQIQQMIRHPNIAQLLDILETENSYYLVMELCPGGNLMHKIYEKKRLEEHEARKYIRQLILAVEHLHRAGVVHRDLKIENLLLDEDNNIKLIAESVAADLKKLSPPSLGRFRGPRSDEKHSVFRSRGRSLACKARASPDKQRGGWLTKSETFGLCLGNSVFFWKRCSDFFW